MIIHRAIYSPEGCFNLTRGKITAKRPPQIHPPKIEFIMARIAEDKDFDYLKQLVDESAGWILELDKADTKVWTRPIDGCSFQMVKIQTIFTDITSETLYDVLHDPDYRKVWDTHMLESLEIGLLNVCNDVGYYASE
jgi:StAR-related lipid transfer protein 10